MHRLAALALAALAIVAAPHAHAGPLVGIDALSSTVLYEGQSSFSGIALRARIQPPGLVSQVELLPTFEYWRNASTVHPYGIKATRKDATLGLDARFNFDNPRWRPYLGAGWAVHFISATVSAPSLGVADADDAVIKGSLTGLAGVTFVLSDRIDNLFEAKYHHLSDHRQLKINWGLAFKL